MDEWTIQERKVPAIKFNVTGKNTTHVSNVAPAANFGLITVHVKYSSHLVRVRGVASVRDPKGN